MCAWAVVARDSSSIWYSSGSAGTAVPMVSGRWPEPTRCKPSHPSSREALLANGFPSANVRPVSEYRCCCCRSALARCAADARCSLVSDLNGTESTDRWASRGSSSRSAGRSARKSKQKRCPLQKDESAVRPRVSSKVARPSLPTATRVSPIRSGPCAPCCLDSASTSAPDSSISRTVRWRLSIGSGPPFAPCACKTTLNGRWLVYMYSLSPVS
mmetsp:Transcript_2123/g.6514  ORF Transcript_2123/g.6514 Transcript_2123/m.6514 type:complete len:214 (+) Transcript_2123:244-885(+)